mgnify:CR=1 FL=1
MPQSKPKSFWSKPEGVTGAIFLIAALLAGGWAVAGTLGAILAFAKSTAGLVTLLGVLGVVIFTALDSKARNLISYMYKSAMRKITGLFVTIDPIGILKNYVDDLRTNLRKMNRQLSMLRGQMHKLKEMIINNQKEIKTNMTLAKEAKAGNNNKIVILKTRKAGRLRDSNMKLEDLYKRMEVLYRVLNKMYENSSILLEDVQDQVQLKDQERKAIRASHSAMKSAMSIIKGDGDKRAMFDQALEAVADDVSQKVGEMERFMDMSESFMNSIDLQNGIFEDEGMKMLEKWEAESDSLILGDDKSMLLLAAEDDSQILDLNEPIKQPEKMGRGNQYDNFFDD